MCSFIKDQKCFLMDLLQPPPPTPRAMQIQHEEGDSKLALRLAIADYHIADQNLFGTLSRKYSMSCSTLQRYIRETMMSDNQYK